MKLNPLFDRVIIRVVNEQKTQRGIMLPESSKEKPNIGEVVAVGPGDEKTKICVNIGDKILYPKYAGVEFKHENELLTVLRQTEILLIFDKE